MKQSFTDLLEANSIIAAVKTDSELENCLKSDCQVIFVLFGGIVTISSIVGRIKQANKVAIVHIDLVEGLSPREVAVDFIASTTQADGIISTRSALLKYAKFEHNLYTVQRFFVLDSLALSTAENQLETKYIDALEILPGVMPKIIRRLVQKTTKPIIASGLIEDKEDVISAITSGAIAISSTDQNVWFM